MGRRRVFGTRGPEERASLGDVHVENAVSEINRICQKTAAVMAHYNHTREHTLPMLFRDEDLAKLEAVRGMVDCLSSAEHYVIHPDTLLGISYLEAKVPTIAPRTLEMQPGRLAPLQAFVAEAEAIYLKFEEVKAVLKWLNRNATPGAIRYFFPTAMKLCPDSPIWRDLQEVPDRYNTPAGITSWLQAIKNAANTMAAAALLPSDAQARVRKQMWLTFTRRGVALNVDGLHYSTDAITFNL